MGKRRAYVRLPDRILREQWDDATLADIVRLQAFLNTRWARDGLSADEAGRCELGPQEMMLVTRTTNVTRARGRLLALPERSGGVTLTVRSASQGRYRTVIVEWPKFASEQGYYDREEPKLVPDKSPPPPPPLTPPQDADRKGNGAVAPRSRSPRKASRKPVKAPETLCPERLEPDERELLRKWARARGLTDSQIGFAWSKVRDWSHSKQEFRASWLAQTRNAIRDGWGLTGYTETDDERYRRELSSSPFRVLEGGSDAG